MLPDPVCASLNTSRLHSIRAYSNASGVSLNSTSNNKLQWPSASSSRPLPVACEECFGSDDANHPRWQSSHGLPHQHARFSIVKVWHIRPEDVACSVEAAIQCKQPWAMKLDNMWLPNLEYALSVLLIDCGIKHHPLVCICFHVVIPQLLQDAPRLLNACLHSRHTIR